MSVEKVSNNYLLWVLTHFLIGMNLLKTSSLKGTRCGFAFPILGPTKGEFMGLSPTGKKIRAEAVDIYRIVNGKLAEYWNVTDNVNIFKQVGAIEITEKGKQLFSDEAK